ncbi:AAA family ATPase [Embleya sp. NPDC059237]|uniref:AAA family ATPase n=1 Tax=Embleya sp. NPDC059237 TaxID=3346784 RepID=UPI003679B05C
MGAVRALAVGIGRFTAGEDGEVVVGSTAWADLPFVDDVVPSVVGALARLGYDTHVLKDVHAAELRDGVGAALGQVRVVYVAAHGEGDENDPQRVDVVPADALVGRDTDVSGWVRDAHRLGNASTPTLFLLDLCHSGRAATLPHLVHRAHSPTNAWVIAASSGREAAYDGRFSRVVAEVLEEVAETGLDTDPERSHVSFTAVARRIRARMERSPGLVQHVQSTAIEAAADEPHVPFFPNPNYDPGAPALAAVDPALRVFLDPGDARHFTDKAGTAFTGRRTQLAELAPWLDDIDIGGLRVVTGNPGVGKSALLGALACAAHPELAALVPQVRQRLQAGDPLCCPSVSDRLAAVHARGRTCAEVLGSLARQLVPYIAPRERAVTATTLATSLAVMEEIPAVVVDALDEATEPAATCAALTHLARATREDGRPVARLLVGTRPWPIFAELLELSDVHDGLLNLDHAEPREVRKDLTTHITGRLADLDAYRRPRMRTIRHALADAIAERLTSSATGEQSEWGAFLVADVFIRYLTCLPAPIDSEEATRIGESVPTTLPTVLDLDLDARPHGRHVRALLSCLALAQGEGMPLDIALPMTTLFAPDANPRQSRTLLPDALFYLRATPDTDGTLLYRLFHQGLVDHLTRRPPAHGHRAPTPDEMFDHLLHVHTTTDGALRGWDSAPPYLLRHATAHAEHAGRLDELLVDSEFLVLANPAVLLAAFSRARSDAALTARAVYRTSIGIHRHADSTTRRRVLALDAARHNTPPLLTALNRKTRSEAWKPLAATGGTLVPIARDTLTGHSGPVRALACTTVNGRPVVVTASDDHTARVWDLATGETVGRPLSGHAGSVRAVACARVGGRAIAVTGSNDRTARVWDLATGTNPREPLDRHLGWVSAVVYAEMEGKTVAVTGSSDHSSHLWDLSTGECLGRRLGRRYKNPTGRRRLTETGPVRALAAATLDGRPVIVTGGGDRIARVWDLATGAFIGNPLHHANPVSAVACAVFDSRPVVLTGSGDATVRMWDLATGEAVGQALQHPGHAVSALACAVLDGRTIAITGSTDHTARIWDLETGELLGRPLSGHTAPVNTVAYSIVDGHPVVVTGSDDHTVRVWDVAGDERGKPPAGHSRWVSTVACVVSDGRLIAVTGSHDHTVGIWDSTTGEPSGKRLTGHTRWVGAAACTTLNGRPVAITGSGDCTARVWDVATGEPVGEPLSGHTGAVNAVMCTTLDGRPVAVTGSHDRTARVWDLTTGSPIGEPLDGHPGPVTSVSHSIHDGRPLAITCAGFGHNRMVRTWDLAAGEPRGAILQSGVGKVNTAAYAVLNDRPVVVTGSGSAFDGDVHDVQVWDLLTAKPLGEPLRGHTGPVNVVTCAVLDGRPIAVSGSDDHTIRIWDLRTRVCVDRIRMPAAVRAVGFGAHNLLLAGFDVDVSLWTRQPQPTPGSAAQDEDAAALEVSWSFVSMAPSGSPRIRPIRRRT